MEIKKLAVLTGEKTTIKNGRVEYTPTYSKLESKDDDEKLSEKPISADIRSNIVFTQGTLEYKFKAENTNTGVIVTWEEMDKTPHCAAGLTYSGNTFIIDDRRIGTRYSKGNLSKFKKNEEIAIRIEILGSNGKLFVNDILYCESIINPSFSPLTFRVTSKGKVSLYDIKIDKVMPKVFVVMQFSESFNQLYSDVIKPVSEAAGYECIRADEFYSSTPILNDIIKSIRESSIIIADITPDNPNVFYEIGYAHAIQKPTILICDKQREKLPFDVSSFRTLFYENSIAGKSKVENNLKKYLENIQE